MLVIRLSRTGRRNQPKYRLVVAEHSAPIKGKVVEILGHYDPTSAAKTFVFDKEKTTEWIKKGAKASDTVARILNGHGFDLPVHIRPEGKPKKAAQAKLDKAAAPAPAAAPAATDEPAPTEAETEAVAAEEPEVASEAPAEVEPAPAEAPAEELVAEDKPEAVAPAETESQPEPAETEPAQE